MSKGSARPRFMLRELLVVIAGICVLLAFAIDVEPFAFTARLGAAEPSRDAAQTPVAGGGNVVVDRKRIMRGRFDELAAKLESDNALERQGAAHWLGVTEWPDAQAERAVQLLCQLLEFPDRYPRETVARAIQRFACVNPSHGAPTSLSHSPPAAWPPFSSAGTSAASRAQPPGIRTSRRTDGRSIGRGVSPAAGKRSRFCAAYPTMVFLARLLTIPGGPTLPTTFAPGRDHPRRR